MLLLIIAAGCDRFDNSTNIGGDVTDDIGRTDDTVHSVVQSFAIVEEIGSERNAYADSTVSLIPVGRWRGERSYAYIDFDTLLQLNDTIDSCRVWLRLDPQDLAISSGADTSMLDTTIDFESFELSMGTAQEKAKRGLLDAATVTDELTVTLNRQSNSMRIYEDDSVEVSSDWGGFTLLDSVIVADTAVWDTTIVNDTISTDSIVSDTTYTPDTSSITYDTLHSVLDMRGLFIVLGPAAGQDSIVRLERPRLTVECYVDTTVPDTAAGDSATKDTTVLAKVLLVTPSYWDHSVLEDDAAERDGLAFTSRAPRRYTRLKLSLGRVFEDALDSSDGHGFRAVASANITVPLGVSAWEAPKNITEKSGAPSTAADSIWHGGPRNLLPAYEMTRSPTKPDAMYSDGYVVGRRLDDEGSDSVGFGRFYVRPILDSLWNDGDPLTDEAVYLYIDAPYVAHLVAFRQAVWGAAPGDSLPVELVLTIPQ